MRVAIDITEAINGWRFDVLEDGKPSYKENCTTKEQAFLYLAQYVTKQLKPKLPTHTMDVI